MKLASMLASLLVTLSACGLLARASTVGLPQSRQIEGIVLDQMGAPIVDAEVSLKAGEIIVAQTKTDVDGRFVFNAVTVDAATLAVVARGFSKLEQNWTAQRGVSSTLKFVLTPAPLSEEVTMTASRTETRLGETAASIVVLSRAELSTTSAETIDDALRQVPGFQLFRRSGSRNANPTSQGVSLRGVGASGASRAVVLEDGIPLNDPFGGWVYWGRVSRESISRIEVLRGGASALYGSAALGGVVQLITRRAAAEPIISFETSDGNEQTPDASLFMGGRRGRWGASLSGELFHTNGYILVDEMERGRVDTPAGSRHAASELTLERQLTKDARLFIRASYFGESRTNGTPLQTNRTHIRELSAGGDRQSARMGTFTVRAFGSTEVYDQNFSAIATDRSSETLTRLQRVPVQSVGFTAQWSKPVSAFHTLVAGLEMREVRGTSDEIAFIQNRATSLISAGGRERTLGLFAEDIVRLSSRLFITVGARLDRWREFAARVSTRPVSQTAPTTINAFPDRTETAFSPQASALYKFNDNVSLYASASRAFRQPTLNELYRSFRVGNVLTLANENLRAERLTSGEAGANFTSLNRRLNTRATLFWAEITRPVANVTLSLTPALITRQRQNLGRTRSRGLELEADMRLTNRWNISGGYLFSDARVVEFPPDRTLENLFIPQVARHQFTFQLRYANASRFTFGLQGRAASAQFDDDQNLFRLKGYFTLDAFASRKINREFEAFIAAENVFNERYEIGRTPVLTLGPPVLVRVGIRFHSGAEKIN
jgi:outer membrane receptor protein involved in Fe transport